MMNAMNQPSFLIVDSYPTMQRVFRNALTREGFRNIQTFESMECAQDGFQTLTYPSHLVWFLPYPDEALLKSGELLACVDALPGLGGMNWKCIISLGTFDITDAYRKRGVRRLSGYPLTFGALSNEMRKQLGWANADEWQAWCRCNQVDGKCNVSGNGKN